MACTVLGITTVSAATVGPLPLPVLPVDMGLPIGDQPHAPMRSCSFPRLGAQEMHIVYSHWRQPFGPVPAGDALAPDMPAGDSVDPFTPCHIAQVLPRYPGQPAMRVVRSDDNGRHFTTTFVTPPPPPSSDPIFGSTPMSIAPLVIMPAPGEEYLVDTASRYGIVSSSDGGAHWEQRNHGLPLPSHGQATLGALAFAPSNPQVGYVVVVTPAWERGTGYVTTLLFRTTDGGRSWAMVPGQAGPPPDTGSSASPWLQVAATSAETIQDVAVDPADENHVYVADRARPRIWESPDAGTTWSEHPLPQGTEPAALLLTHPEGGRVRLYVKCLNATTGVVDWMRSFDDGQTWTAVVPAPVTGTDSALAVDPLEPDHMILTAQIDPPGGAYSPYIDGKPPLTLYSSEDGFVSVHASGPLQVPWSTLPSLTQKLPWSRPYPYVTEVTVVRLQADRAHHFFLHVEGPQRGPTSLFDSNLGPLGDHLFAFRLSAVGITPPPPPRPSDEVQHPEQTVTRTADVVSGCSLPLVVAQGVTSLNLPPPWGASQQPPSGGSLAYDGHYLDYTEDNQPASTAGLIERVDPLTCQPAPPLHVALPGDPNRGGGPPVIAQLTYDPRYVFRSGRHGTILMLAEGYDRSGHQQPYPIYAADPFSGDVELALSIFPDYGPLGGSCCTVFTYDISRDALWVMIDGHAAPVPMPVLHGDVVTPARSCMSFTNPFGQPTEYAALLAVAYGVMYAQSEDDTTILRADDRSCTLLDGFRHARFNEPPTEDEQIACDPITDGDGSSYAGTAAPTTLIWVRDSVEGRAQAYAVTDGVCPFVTVLRLRASPPVLAGSATTLCAVLERASAEGIPIAGQTVSFTVDGQRFSAGVTDARGRACATAASPPAAGVHAVHADFAGTRVSYLPSSADDVLVTYALGAHAGPPPPALPLLAETPPLPAPGLEPQPQPMPQPLTEAQLQAQANTQSVTQLQPGVMAQRQQQRQVAVEMLPTRMRQPVYQASALRPGRRRLPAAPVAVLAAMLLLGAGLVARRPALLPARIRRR